MPSISISAVIPCFNGVDYVAEAISSIQSQDYPVIEIIVVDDGSTDGSAAKAAQFPGVRVLRQANQGVSAARNAGLALCRGDLVLFLDADDRLLPGALHIFAEEMSADPSIGMSFGGNRKIDRNGDVFGVQHLPRCDYSYQEILLGVSPTPSQCIYRRSAVIEAGEFDPTIRLGEDWELHLRLATQGRILSRGTLIADYRTHPGQQRVPTAALKSALRILDLHETRFSVLYGKAAFEAARRRWKRYYGQYIPSEVARELISGRANRCAASLLVMASGMPYSLFGFVDRFRH